MDFAPAVQCHSAGAGPKDQLQFFSSAVELSAAWVAVRGGRPLRRGSRGCVACPGPFAF